MKNSARRYLFIIIISCMLAVWVNGQPHAITGIVADSTNGEPVEYAQILNFSRQIQTYSNRSGEFTIKAAEGDTMVIYGLGYYYKKVIITSAMMDSRQAELFMTRQPYNLAAANIPGIGDYSDFRDRLIHSDIAKTKTEILNDGLAEASRSAAMEAYQQAMNDRAAQNGVTLMSVNIYTPEEIERMKLAKIQSREKIRDQVYHKFNPALVKEITGLSDDDEIIEFMVWGKFSDTYILEANEYDLAERIAAKFELFRKMKTEKNIKNDPLNRIDTYMLQFA